MKKFEHLAYKKIEGKSPTVVFLSGFKSDMEGTKALFLESLCKEIGHAYIRFDYSGHGKSGGEFKDGTIGQWRDDALKVIDELTEGPIVLIGSSMGGWIMLLAALARPERIKALVGIAAAPDFTEELIWEKFSPQEQQQILHEGQVLIPNCYEDQQPYPITKNLIEEGRKYLLLHNPINITCPVRLIHGMKDEDVPYQVSLRIEEQLESEDVIVRLVKTGDHRMSAPENLELLREQILAIIGE